MSERLRVASIEVDIAARRMAVDGHELHAEPKVFDLLVYLASNSGRAIERDDLLRAVWGRTIASDSVVAQAVRKLRQLLAEHGGDGAAIATVRGVGYRLDAEVVRLDPYPEPAPETSVAPAPAVPRTVTAVTLVLLASLLVFGSLWAWFSSPARSAAPRIALLETGNATGNAGLEWAEVGASALLGQVLGSRGIDVTMPAQLQSMARATGETFSPEVAATRLAGVEWVLEPRLSAIDDGFRLEIIGGAGGPFDQLALDGRDPASLSIALADAVAERIGAGSSGPAGGALEQPFLNEAYSRAYDHAARGQFDQARELYEYILDAVPEHPWTRYQLAIVLRSSGDAPAAAMLLEGLIDQPLDDPALEAAVLTTLGTHHWYAGELERAQQLYSRAHDRFAALGLETGRASALSNLGLVALTRNQFRQGRDYIDQALKIYRRQNNRMNEARLLHNLGNSWMNQGDFDRARRDFERAYAIRNGLGLSDQAAGTLAALGDLAIRDARLREGIAYLERALEEFTSNGNARGRTMVLIDLANAARAQGHDRRARDLGLEALVQARTDNQTAQVAQAALSLARSLRALGDPIGANRRLDESDAAWRQLDNEHGQIVTLAERVRVELERDDFEQASGLLAELGERSEAFGDPRLIHNHRALQTRARLAEPAGGDSSRAPTAVEQIAEITRLFDALDADRLQRAELAAELGLAAHAQDPDHPLLPTLVAHAHEWAPRHFPSAMLVWKTASGPDDCQHAIRAFEALRGERWSDGLEPQPRCSLGQSQ